jgi:hypothetical protein
MSQDMWKDAPEWAMWLAQDSDGEQWFFENRPVWDDYSYWIPDDGEYESIGYECNGGEHTLTPRPDNYIEDMWPEWKQPESPREAQVGGNHYKDMVIQPIEYIAVNGLSFLQGSVVKYVSRYKAKGGLQDLEKAKHCIDLMIEFDYGNTTD